MWIIVFKSQRTADSNSVMTATRPGISKMASKLPSPTAIVIAICVCRVLPSLQRYFAHAHAPPQRQPRGQGDQVGHCPHSHPEAQGVARLASGTLGPEEAGSPCSAWGPRPQLRPSTPCRLSTGHCFCSAVPSPPEASLKGGKALGRWCYLTTSPVWAEPAWAQSRLCRVITVTVARC